MSNQELFENLKRIASAVASQFGPSCEVVVHDLSHLENSIVFIAGDVTGRQVGGPVTDFVLGLLNQEQSPEDLVGYMAQTRDGKALTSSTVFLKDKRGRPIGVFCINFDVTYLVEASKHLTRLATPRTPIKVDKSFSADAPNLLQDMIEESLQRIIGGRHLDGQSDAVSRDQRLAILADLDAMGAFKIRNAVPIVADLFDVTRYTIYKDLKLLRKTMATALNGGTEGESPARTGRGQPKKIAS